MALIRFVFCILTLAAFAGGAGAVPLTWTLAGVTLSDGGTASGSFVYDATTNTFSSVSIVTTTGGTRTGATYTFVCGASNPTCTGLMPSSAGALTVTSSSSNLTGTPGLVLFFSPGLSNAGGASALTGSLEGDCLNAPCSSLAQPIRRVDTGFVVTAVAPVTLTKSFGAATVQQGGSTVLTFTITNPNAFGVSGVAFTDTLPGLVLSSPSFVSATGCGGGNLIIAPGTNLVDLSNLSLAANGVCIFSVNVTAVTGGVQTNVTSTITATVPAPTTGGTATAVITIIPNDVFQVKYFTLQFGGGVLNVTNVGSFFGGGRIPLLDQATDPNGTLCANFYAFDPNEEMVACCACKVTPNGLGSISVKEDILNNILINNPPSSITVKVLSTRGDTGFSCNAANPTLATLRGGLKLWGTTLHSISVQGSPAPPPLTGITETEFARSELSLGELAKLTTYCRFVQILGSQITGICKACRTGALGGAKQ